MTIPRLTLAIFLSALSLSSADPAEWKSARMPRFHDPSTPVRQGKTWVVFSTGTGIFTHYSQDLKTWTDGEPVFKEMPAWHREVVPSQKGHLWAPDVIRINDRFFLYYSVSGWGKNVSAIGLATSPTLDPESHEYHWKDEGIVIRSDDKNPYNAIDPAVFADTNGSLWMVFGSFWTGIQLIELEPKTGLRKGEKIQQLAWNKTIEAAALLKHDDYYYLFANWGICCRGVDSTYEIRIGRSKQITGPYLDASGDDMATGGGTVFLQSEGDKIGPGHASFISENGENRMFFHYYDRQHNGTPTLGNISLKWMDNGWPKVIDPP